MSKLNNAVATSPTSDAVISINDYSKIVRARDVIGYISEKANDIMESYFALAGYFRELDETEGYKLLGFNSLNECCKELLPDFSETLIKNLLLVGRRCFENNNENHIYSVYALKPIYTELTWSKLVELVSLPEDEQLIALIKDKPVKSIREVKKEIKSKGIDFVKKTEALIKNVLDSVKQNFSSNLSDFVKTDKGCCKDDVAYTGTYTDGSFKLTISVVFIFSYSRIEVSTNKSFFATVSHDSELNCVLNDLKKHITELKKEAVNKSSLNALKKKIDMSKAPNKLTDDYDAYVSDVNNWENILTVDGFTLYRIIIDDVEFIWFVCQESNFIFKSYYKDSKSFYHCSSYELSKYLENRDKEKYNEWFDEEIKKLRQRSKRNIGG